jgi:hypothetical protein
MASSPAFLKLYRKFTHPGRRRFRPDISAAQTLVNKGAKFSVPLFSTFSIVPFFGETIWWMGKLGRCVVLRLLVCLTLILGCKPVNGQSERRCNSITISRNNRVPMLWNSYDAERGADFILASLRLYSEQKEHKFAAPLKAELFIIHQRSNLNGSFSSRPFVSIASDVFQLVDTLSRTDEVKIEVLPDRLNLKSTRWLQAKIVPIYVEIHLVK